MKALSTLTLAAALAGCAAVPPRPTGVAQPIPFPTGGAGLGAVMGQNAAHLIRLFGQPDADVQEATGRKLQFQSAICVLDTYLYPRGNAPAVVTYVDARQPDGSPIDRASCVAAIQRRGGGR